MTKKRLSLSRRITSIVLAAVLAVPGNMPTYAQESDTPVATEGEGLSEEKYEYDEDMYDASDDTEKGNIQKILLTVLQMMILVGKKKQMLSVRIMKRQMIQMIQMRRICTSCISHVMISLIIRLTNIIMILIFQETIILSCFTRRVKKLNLPLILN